MIKIFSTDKVRELDKYTIQNEPISSIDLVERAATVFTSDFAAAIPNKPALSYLPDKEITEPTHWQSPVC